MYTLSYIPIINIFNFLYNASASIDISQPIRIIDITQRNFDPSIWIPILIATFTTTLFIWDRIKKPKIYGKIISKTSTQSFHIDYQTRNGFEKLKGQGYILKLSLSCIRKSLNYKNVKVKLTYDNEKVAGTIYWLKYNNLVFDNLDGTKTCAKMLLPPEQFLTYNNVLEQGKTMFLYLSFIVPDKEKAELFDKMQLIFIKPNNKAIKVDIEEIAQEQYFFDDDLLSYD